MQLHLNHEIIHPCLCMEFLDYACVVDAHWGKMETWLLDPGGQVSPLLEAHCPRPGAPGSP